MTKIRGTFELSINDDGKHASIDYHFGETSVALIEWLRYAYLNDLMWRHFWHPSGYTACSAPSARFATVRMDRYKHLPHHVEGDQYLVTEPSEDGELDFAPVVKGDGCTDSVI